ncbi:MAG: carbohydrate kinase [Oscillospiraceae bacterium]|nr:carbohydrate kinase [Oscillospiraceae bacterium]
MSGFDITALGELLIDYTQVGVSPSSMELYEQNPGGAPANVLACAAKLGHKTAFLGKIGADAQGEFLRNTLHSVGINTDGLITDDSVFTTLAFVSLSNNGERRFSFARKPGADTHLSRDELELSVIRTSRIFHFGSLSLTDEPARGATRFAISEAGKAGCIISYDPNYRPLLWKSEAQAKEMARSVLPYVDMIKLSEEETELITGFTEPDRAAKYLVDSGIDIAAVTLGEKGVLIASNDGCDTVPGFEVSTVDTTGAGDAFWGAFLFSVGKLRKKPCEIDFSEILRISRFSNAAAALCVTKRGAIPSMPLLREVEELLSGRQ